MCLDTDEYHRMCMVSNDPLRVELNANSRTESGSVSDLGLEIPTLSSIMNWLLIGAQLSRAGKKWSSKGDFWKLRKAGAISGVGSMAIDFETIPVEEWPSDALLYATARRSSLDMPGFFRTALMISNPPLGMLAEGFLKLYHDSSEIAGGLNAAGEAIKDVAKTLGLLEQIEGFELPRVPTSFLNLGDRDGFNSILDYLGPGSVNNIIGIAELLGNVGVGILNHVVINPINGIISLSQSGLELLGEGLENSADIIDMMPSFIDDVTGRDSHLIAEDQGQSSTLVSDSRDVISTGMVDPLHHISSVWNQFWNAVTKPFT